MSLFRLFVLGMIVWLALRVIRSWNTTNGGDARGTGAKPYEPMARCERCAVHVPRAELSAGECRRCREPVVR